MHTLIPFPPEKAKFLLEADVQISGTSLVFDYHLRSGSELFQLPEKNLKPKSSDVPRADGLWNQTCFEAFLNPVGLKTYFEFNFSLDPAWNLYRFEYYRNPQPPKPSADFVLKNYTWNFLERRLKVEVQNNSEYKKFNAGLTAVLKPKNQEIYYYALAHAGTKPDFHMQQSFTIIRG